MNISKYKMYFSNGIDIPEENHEEYGSIESINKGTS
jgi:hypothetical protein